MSYYRKRYRGGAVGDVESVIKSLSSAVSTGVQIGSDPYLPETICRAQQLVAIENHTAIPPCANTPSGQTGGIGLRIAVPVLRGLVYGQQHKWIYPVAVAGVIGVPMLIGYLLGKGSRR